MAANDTVGSIARFPAVVVAPGQTLRELAKAMHDAEVGAVLVHARDGSLAIVTERDIVWATAEGSLPDRDWAVDVMTRVVKVVPTSMTVGEAGRTMLDAGIRHLVVLDGDREGMVSLREVARALLA